MLARIGRKLVQGATAEIQENPPEMLNPNRWSDLLETGVMIATLLLMISGNLRASTNKPVTVIVNNYITKG